MRIELTNEQRRMVEEQGGRPVEVIDPDTKRTYVLVAQEQYERVRTLLEPATPPSSAPASPATQENDVKRFRLNDLPTPPEIAEEVERCCKEYGWPRKGTLDELKLQYYFGGQVIYTVRTSQGVVVVPIPQRLQNAEGVRDLLLAPEEREHACLDVPSVWQDTNAIIG